MVSLEHLDRQTATTSPNRSKKKTDAPPLLLASHIIMNAAPGPERFAAFTRPSSHTARNFVLRRHPLCATFALELALASRLDYEHRYTPCGRWPVGVGFLDREHYDVAHCLSRWNCFWRLNRRSHRRRARGGANPGGPDPVRAWLFIRSRVGCGPTVPRRDVFFPVDHPRLAFCASVPNVCRYGTTISECVDSANPLS